MTADGGPTAGSGQTADSGQADGRQQAGGEQRAAARPPAPGLLAAAGLVTAALLAAMWLRFGASPVLPAFGYLAVVSVALAFIDVRERRLPDRLTLPSYPAALALLAVAAPFAHGGARHLLSAVAGMAAAFAFYVLQAFIYPAGIGWGDVKLSGVLGLYLGWFGARALLAGLAGGYVLAAIAGVALIAAGRATRKSHIPFGPFMLAAALAVILVPVLSR